NLTDRFPTDYPPVFPDVVFTDGEKFSVAGIEFTAIITAGHTVGSTCFVSEDKIFSGDTLFFESVGRIDFPGGDGEMMRKSLMKLFSLNGDYEVYPGHGESTTLSHEREYNPFR
ncbi:MAG: MBL fold metallo-hydrolase, partial [Clostridia bacterium]|nr:MBL fold metallo-hydrolase [Clostridia bacterium]